MPAMRGTSGLPPVAMSYTMPRPMASCVFHRSCPVRPGSANASAMSASVALEGGKVRRGSIPQTDRLGFLFGRLLGVAPLEFFDAARGVHDLRLAGVEGVRLRRHLDLDHGIFLAVFPLHGLAALGIDGRAREEGMIRAGVEEDHRLVFGMGA